MPGIGEGGEELRDRRLVIGDDDGLRFDIDPGGRERRHERGTARVLALPRRGTVRAGHDDGLMRGALRLRRGVARPAPAAAALLGDQLHPLDHDVTLQRLGHVVQRQRRHGRRGERLHLDPGAGRDADLGRDRHAPSGAIRRQVHRHSVEGQRMAQRDEVGRALRPRDAGDARDGEGVTLGAAGVEQRGERLRTHPDGRGRQCPPRGDRLAADVNHAGLAPGSQVAGLHTPPPSPMRIAS